MCCWNMTNNCRNVSPGVEVQCPPNSLSTIKHSRILPGTAETEAHRIPSIGHFLLDAWALVAHNAHYSSGRVLYPTF